MRVIIRKWSLADRNKGMFIQTEVYQQSIGTRQEIVAEHNALVEAYEKLKNDKK